MGKNVIIQEGGIAKQLTADKLKTNLVGSGTCLWVPEDEVQLTTKTITENGTYKASDDGYYGYSEINVSGIGTVSGTGPTTGEDVVVTTDPETGEIVETTVPHSIRVVTPPYNPYGIYTNGQAITNEGMEVRALLANGDLWDDTSYPDGLIPNSELTLNPTTAVYDASTDEGASASSDISEIQEYMPIPISTSVLFTTSYNGRDYVNSEIGASPFESITAFQLEDGLLQLKYLRASRTPAGTSYYEYTYNGKTVYYQPGSYGSNYPIRDVDPVIRKTMPSGTSDIVKKIAWTMIYGEISRAGSRQEITVSWPRAPRQDKVLETTFEILVAPPIYGDSEN